MKITTFVSPFLLIVALLAGDYVGPATAGTKAVTLQSSCPAPGKHKSPNSETAVNARFVNKTAARVTLLWIGFDGSLKQYGSIGRNQRMDLQSYAGHSWLAIDKDGNCYGGVMTIDPAASTIEIR